MEASARRRQLSRWAPIALIIVLLPLAGASLVRGMFKANQTICDFEQFWVSGVLVRQGMNPYRVFLEDRELLLDQYAFPYNPDWTCADALPDRPNYNTPLLSLLMAPLTLMEFETARAVWAGLQVVMALALPLVMLRLNWRIPGAAWQVAAVLLLMAWAPTRTTFAHGQVALLTSLALVVSIVLARRGQPLWAGLLLGLALSKYTLTGAVVLFFLVYRYYRVIGVALLTQLVGLLAMWPFVGETPFQIAGSYASLLTNVIGQSYEIVSLDGWLNVAGMDATLSALLAFGAGFLIVVALVLPRYVGEALGRPEELPEPQRRLKANLLVVIMALVGLLFVYHRSYDLPLAFVFVTFLMGLVAPASLMSRANRAYALLLAAGIILNGVVIMPPSLPARFFAEPTSFIVAAIPVTLALLLALGAAIFALHRLPALGVLGFESAPERRVEKSSENVRTAQGHV